MRITKLAAYNAIDLTGHTYNRLTVIKLNRQTEKRKYWDCICSCGKSTVTEGSKLRNGSTKSCGCYRTECITNYSITHGMAGTPEYGAWLSMKYRCFDKNGKSYNDYGGRGITVFQEWIDSFETFYAYLGNRPSSKHSLDRIDVNGHYEPGNVRWTTQKTQANNQRTNHRITYNGETKTMSEWADSLGIPSWVIGQRITKYGWTIEDALTKPTNYYQHDVTFNGKTKKISEWANETGFSSKLLYKRIFTLNWPVDKALSVPSVIGRNQYSA